MGYGMDQREAVFTIKKENKSDALKAIRALAKEAGKMSGGSWLSTSRETRHFSWVDMEFVRAKTLEVALEAWRWEPVVDEKTGDITSLTFLGEKLGDDQVLWKAVAPFVESGSYISMYGEDGSNWVWRFVDGKFEEA